MKFENPYKDLDEPKMVRLQTWVDKTDHNLIFRDLHPGQGSVTIITNMLFAKLAEACRKNGITTASIDRERFEEFLSNAELTVKKPKKVTHE